MEFLEPTQQMQLDRTEFANENDSLNASGHVNAICGKLRLCSDGADQEFSISFGDNYIGRDPMECKIVVNSKSLSRIHAAIDGQRGGCAIMDLNSSNGTFKGPLKLKSNMYYVLTFLVSEIGSGSYVIKDS